MRSGGEARVPVQPGDLSENRVVPQSWDGATVTEGTRALPTAGTAAFKPLHLSGLRKKQVGLDCFPHFGP